MDSCEFVKEGVEGTWTISVCENCLTAEPLVLRLETIALETGDENRGFHFEMSECFLCSVLLGTLFCSGQAIKYNLRSRGTKRQIMLNETHFSITNGSW